MVSRQVVLTIKTDIIYRIIILICLIIVISLSILSINYYTEIDFLTFLGIICSAGLLVWFLFLFRDVYLVTNIYKVGSIRICIFGVCRELEANEIEKVRIRRTNQLFNFKQGSLMIIYLINKKKIAVNISMLNKDEFNDLILLFHENNICITCNSKEDIAG